MENNIKQLFSFVYNKGRDIQYKTLNGEQIDGKSVWNSIEKKVKNIIILDEIKYNDSLHSIYEKMDKIIEKFDIANNEYNPVANHFFLQLKNLVSTKSNFIIHVYRILQIAYNAGQLSILLENKKLNEEISEFVLQNNMLDLDTYVSKDNQKNISMNIQDHVMDDVLDDVEQKGGYTDNYKKKYLKYKQKYLNLKK
jgi:hypothetical protein